jgi:hypothetical protein
MTSIKTPEELLEVLSVVCDEREILVAAGFLRSLLDERGRLREALATLTREYEEPTYYEHEDDDVGRCGYCNEWNMHHLPACPIILGRQALTGDKP